MVAGRDLKNQIRSAGGILGVGVPADASIIFGAAENANKSLSRIFNEVARWANEEMKSLR